MSKTTKVIVYIICIAAIVSFLSIIIVSMFMMFNPKTIDFNITNIIDQINTFFIAIIALSICINLRYRIRCWKLLYVISAINLGFVFIGLFMQYSILKMVLMLILSFSNFAFEFYLGLNLFRLEDDKYVKQFGLAVLINSILWLIYVAFQYVTMVSHFMDAKYMMILGLLDPLSCIYIIITIMIGCKNYQVRA